MVGNCIKGRRFGRNDKAETLVNILLISSVTQPSVKAVGQTHAEWQTFEKPVYMRPVGMAQSTLALKSYK